MCLHVDMLLKFIHSFINTFERNRSVIDNVRNNNDRVDNRPGLILIINHDYFYSIEIFFNQTLFCNRRFYD